MHVVDIYRDNLLLFGVKVDGNDNLHVKRIQGENEIRLNFVENQYINFKIGDYCTIFSETFYLNFLPVVTKLSSREYRYQMTLQADIHALARAQFLFLGDDNSLKEGEFSLTGKAADFVDLVIRNTLRLPEFTFLAGQIIDDGYRTLTFASQNCLEALAMIAEAFNTEYYVEDEVIHITKMQRDTGYTFRLGKAKGLYELTRKNVDSESVITRLFSFGSDKNLPENYRNYSKRLKLPAGIITTVSNVTWSIFDNGNGTQTYTFTFDQPPGGTALTQILSRPLNSSAPFGAPSALSGASVRTYTTTTGDWEFIFRTMIGFGGIVYTTPVLQAIASTSQPFLPFVGEVIYLEKNIDLYGVREATKFFDEVFPHRTGTVTAVNVADPNEFTDTSMDFDVNAQLLPGMTAKVTFNSGQLTGYTFEISSYNNATKKFIVLQNKQERAIDVPSADFRPAIGDNYVIVDIYLPASYITAAENELQTKAQAYLDTVADPQLTYQLTFDPVYLRDLNRTMNIGDLIWIVDDPLQITSKIRVISFTRNIVQEFEYVLEISNTLPKPRFSDLVQSQTNIKNTVSTIVRSFQNNAVLNQRVIGPVFYRDLPQFVDNAAALAGGLQINQAYYNTTLGGITVVQ